MGILRLGKVVMAAVAWAGLSASHKQPLWGCLTVGIPRLGSGHDSCDGMGRFVSLSAYNKYPSMFDCLVGTPRLGSGHGNCGMSRFVSIQPKPSDIVSI